MAPPTPTEQCPFQGALEMLGKRHTLAILWTLQQRAPRRFTGLKEAAGVNPVTLSSRLSELEEAGVVSRTEFKEAPPRVEYGLTEKGEALLVVLDDLEAWAKEHDEAEGAEAPTARSD